MTGDVAGPDCPARDCDHVLDLLANLVPLQPVAIFKYIGFMERRPSTCTAAVAIPES